MKKSILATLMVSALAASYANAANQDSAATKKRIAAVEKEYNQARAKCNLMVSTDKDNCMADARKWHANAIADARAGRTDGSTMVGSTATAQTGAGTGTPVSKAEALRECEKMTGDQKTACVLERPAAKGTTAQSASKAVDKTQDAAARAVDKTQAAVSNAANRTENAAERAAARTENAAERAAIRTDRATDRAAVRTDRAADRTENATERAIDKTRTSASNVADRTENAAERAADKTKVAAANVADKTDRATDKAGETVADAVITTRVKTDLFKEPDLKALAIHVETEKGVVMLSGFVNSKEEANRAVKVAKGVKGVSNVKSALLVK
jgi:osmotically-inducible protein OsmY